MKTKSKTLIIQSSPENVFTYMDNIGNTGMHMTKSSAPMMGSKLELKQLSENATGLNSTYQWYGKMMGLTMDFTVVVTQWTQDKEKIWETVGEAKMIILSWYKMKLLLTPVKDTTQVELSIDYEIPKTLFFRILGFLLAPLYANWCLNNMLQDSKKSLELL